MILNIEDFMLQKIGGKAMAENSSYGQKAITSLKGENQVRLRPAVIFGTNDEYGAAHGIYEIIANSIDEARAGFGKQIRINIWKDGTVEVSDDGRGIPMGWNEDEQKYNWELVFCTLYASGKYDSSNYGDALGLNGLGATAMQYASEFMDVYSTRDGKTSYMHFEKGRPIGQLKVSAPVREGTGTTIKFKPDPEVFINIRNMALPPDYYINLLRRQAMLHDGLEIIFWHEELGKTINLCYPNGIKDFVKAICEKPIIKNPVYFADSKFGTDKEDEEKYELKMRFAFTFSRDVSLTELYHNGSHMYEGGVTMEALKFGVAKAFTDHAIEQSKIGKNDKILFKDIESIMIIVGDTSAPGHRTYFKNQTKGAINNPFIKQAFMEFIYYSMRLWLTNGKEESARVLGEVLANKAAREEADKVSKKVVQSLSKNMGLGNKPKKFVDCRSKVSFERELYIVEGDSALGSVKLSRDAGFQAIMPVRGKILNCLKKELSVILNNDIIIDLMRVLGCGFEAKSEYIEDLPQFDITKLRWGKIIICTDADLDGMQIRCLVITMIYRLCPTLLKAGKVFIAETPLFEITYGKNTYFAYTEGEKVKILDQLASEGANISKVRIQRSKGLGENDPEMMAVSTMSPLTRRLIPVEYPSDDSNVASYFDALLGDDIETRRILINEYFEATKVDIE